MKPVYFDMSVHDLERARAFLAAALGWRLDRFRGPEPGGLSFGLVEVETAKEAA